MAWIYLAELEDLQSRCGSTSDQSSTAKSSAIAKLYFVQESQTASCRTLQFGTTLEPLLPPHSPRQRQSILFMEASRARTSAVQALESAWKESEADYFSRSLGFVARFDPNSFSWRTYQTSLFEDLPELVLNLPGSGMIVDGKCYELARWDVPNVEPDGGLWPTLTARDFTSPGV